MGKVLRVFDLDDTLVKTSSVIKVADYRDWETDRKSVV